MDAHVRLLHPSDRKIVEELHTSLEVRYPRSFFDQLELGGNPEGGLFYDDPTRILSYVVEVDRVVVGVVTTRISVEATSWTSTLQWLRGLLFGGDAEPKKTAYIMTLAVHPAWRRKGIGKQLLMSLIETLRRPLPDDDGRVSGYVSTVELHCLPTNKVACQLYKGLGFIVKAHLPNHYYFHGRYHDALHLELDLKPEEVVVDDIESGGVDVL